MSDKDTRVFMYRGQEARMFEHPDQVPAGEGWKDHPHDLPSGADVPAQTIDAPASDVLAEQLRASLKKPKTKKADADVDPPVDNVDGN